MSGLNITGFDGKNNLLHNKFNHSYVPLTYGGGFENTKTLNNELTSINRSMIGGTDFNFDKELSAIATDNIGGSGSDNLQSVSENETQKGGILYRISEECNRLFYGGDEPTQQMEGYFTGMFYGSEANRSR
jgi:hypothetical protein